MFTGLSKDLTDFLQLHEFHGVTKYSSASLDKLAQLAPDTDKKNIKASNILHQQRLKNEGVKVFDNFTLNEIKRAFDKKTVEYYRKKASSKWLTNKILQPLTFLPSELNTQYVNASKCGNVIQLDGGEQKTYRCKTRFCVECNRIRTGKLINRYLPVLEQWQNKQFLTLTVPNVTGSELNDKLNEMQKTVSLIQKKWKRKKKNSLSLQQQHGNLELIKKIEITYNFKTKTFHPHYHIITKNLIGAEYLKNNWMQYFKNTSEQAQDIRSADDKTVKELFKYFTKFWKFDYQNKKVELYSPGILDTIFLSLRGRRVVQPAGFKAKDYAPKYNYTNDEIYSHLHKAAEELREKYEGITNHKENKGLKKLLFNTGYYVYDYKLSDWVDRHTGEILTGYKQPENINSWFIQNLTEADHYNLIDYSPTNHDFNLLKQFEWQQQQAAKVRVYESNYIRSIKNNGQTEEEKRRQRLMANEGLLIHYISERKQREEIRVKNEIAKQKDKSLYKHLETKRGTNGGDFGGIFTTPSN